MFVVLVLAMLLFVPVSTQAGEPQKDYSGFYWEHKYDFQYFFTGPMYSKKVRGDRAVDWTLIGGGVWLGGFKNDLILLGGVSLQSNAGRDGIALAVTPIGFRLGRGGKMQKWDSRAALKPTYAYILGNAGRGYYGPHRFGLQFSFAFR